MKSHLIRLQIKLEIAYYKAMIYVEYPFYMFDFWRLLMTKQWFLETEKESFAYFWDGLSRNRHEEMHSTLCDR